MPKTTKEWEMVQELYEMIDDLDTPEQQHFVRSLYENLDPHEPFLDQMEGLDGGENQEKWLCFLHEKFVNGDEEAAREYYE